MANQSDKKLPISTYNFTTECGKRYIFEELFEKKYHLFYPIYPGVPQPDRFFQVNGFLKSSYFLNGYEDFLNMKIRDDDVWICSFPRSGTTWTAEMIWCIINNFDFATAENKSLAWRVPVVDIEITCVEKLVQYATKQGKRFKDLKYLESLNSPRILWCHSALIFLPLQLQNRINNAKIIYALRDPIDVCLSSYLLRKSFVNFPSTFDEYCDMFLNENTIIFGPYWKHVESYLSQNDNPNLYITRYEDKIEDLRKVIKDLANFLGKKVTQVEIDKLYEHLQFEKMKLNPQVSLKERYSRFKIVLPNVQNAEQIRVGKAGQGKQNMSPAYLTKFEEKMAHYNV